MKNIRCIVGALSLAVVSSFASPVLAYDDAAQPEAMAALNRRDAEDHRPAARQA